ncbi:MAG: MBL fold metallo-hydrolase [Candidatus Polarisedimenticolia bacterium]
MIRVGSYEVAVLEIEKFRLDGGAMFGVVPRALWEKEHPADKRNRIRMVTRSLLVRGEGRVVLVDTGLGEDWSAKELDLYGIESDASPLHRALDAEGLAAGDVTDVIFSHLHFDHAGGAVRQDGDRLVASFPNARHYAQKDQLTWAESPTEKDRRSFRPHTLEPLKREGRFTSVRGVAEVAPGIHVEPTQGHTMGHQIVRIGEGEGAVVYCGDLIPTAAHVPAAWVMAYDLQPLVTMKEKRALLERAAASGEILAIEHDPGCEAVRVAREGDGFKVVDRVTLGPPGNRGPS